jgi:hypothetical protein
VPCGAAFGWAFASPPALPRTRLAPGPPGPDSSALLVCRSCGAASGSACASPSALPQISLATDPWNLPPILIACSCPPALPPVQLAPRLRPCLELVSGSRLLQHIRPEPATSYRLSILRPPSRLGSDFKSFGVDLSTRPFSSALRCRPQFSLATASAGFALGLSFHSGLAPFVSAQPSCRLPAPAFDAGLAPFVSCLSFRPAFWPASLRRVGSRLRAFVLKRPSGMPLDLRSQPARACCFVRPSVRFPELVPFSPALRHRPLACASADCSDLAAFTSYGCQLPTACGSPGSRSVGTRVPLNPPSRLFRLRSACAARRFETGLLILPRRPRYR